MEVEGLLEVKRPNNTEIQGKLSSKAHCVNGKLLGKDWEQQSSFISKHDPSITHCWIRQGWHTVLHEDGAVEKWEKKHFWI